MATYYLSPAGSDANNGLGPDASHATNKPWLTWGKALGAAGLASGDTLYVAPGTYRQTNVSVLMTNPTAETRLLGDPTNAQGFRDGSGVLLTPGYVISSGYTTNDRTNPGGAANILLNSRDYLTFENILFMGGNLAAGACCITSLGSTSSPQHITIRNCVFHLGRSNANALLAAAIVHGDVLDWLIERCIFFAYNESGVRIEGAAGATADWNLGVTIRNCLSIGGNPHYKLSFTGAGTFKPGGMVVQNCTLFAGSRGVHVSNACSTTIPCVVTNCAFYYGDLSLNGTTVGDITEDYNLIMANTPRTNVTAGANSVVPSAAAAYTYAPLFEAGQAQMWGFQPRLFGTPMQGSPWLGWAGPTYPSVDLLNRPRPAGSALSDTPALTAAVGALERHDTARQETTTVDASGSALRLVGPADHDIKIPVDSNATLITIKARFDTNHAATNKPQAILLANPAIGVSTETQTMTAAVDVWETLSFASFTPSQRGVVTLRLVSRAAAANGIAFWDTLTVQ